MNDDLERYKEYCLVLCNRLNNDLERNKDEADEFFGGDIYRAYFKATDEAINKVNKIRNKIRRL